MCNEDTDRPSIGLRYRYLLLFSRCYQITLRGLLGLVLLLCIALGWGVNQHQRFRSELRTATELEKKHEAYLTGPHLADGSLSSRPLWDLRQIAHGRLYSPITGCDFTTLGTIDESAWDLLVSIDYIDYIRIQESQLPESATFAPFSRLRVLEITESRLSSEQYLSISRVPKLVELTLINVGIKDYDLRFLQGSTQLESLDLSRNELTDNCATLFRRLNRLEFLNLNDTAMTGAVLHELTCRRTLRRLHLGGVCVRDEDLKTLSECSNLEELSLDGTCISDAGLHWIAGLANLRALYLGDTDVGDESVRLLSKSSNNIKQLDLSGTRISEACIPFLLEMPSLEMDHCRLGRTDVSSASISRLRARGS